MYNKNCQLIISYPKDFLKDFMSTYAVIAEYNPFHNGHLYQLSRLKKDSSDRVVVIMSGNFVQRGEPAILDKWKRAGIALENGADMVISLPVGFSVSTAATFAYGAVKILNGTGIIDRLSFGTEEKDIDKLISISRFLLNEPPLFRSVLRDNLSSGLSYAKARDLAVREVLGEESGDILSLPNNILATEYIKSLLAMNSSIVPENIVRNNAHDGSDINGGIASGLEIRRMMYTSRDISSFVPFSQDILDTDTLPDPERFFSILMYRLRTEDPRALEDVPEAGEGIGRRFHEAAKTATTLEDLYEMVKSKRFSLSRIRRIACQYVLGITKEYLNLLLERPFIHVLGIRKESSPLLAALSERSVFPVYTNLKDVLEDELIKKEAEASDIYSSVLKKPSPSKRDLTEKFISL